MSFITKLVLTSIHTCGMQYSDQGSKPGTLLHMSQWSDRTSSNSSCEKHTPVSHKSTIAYYVCIQPLSLHSLLKERVDSGLADDEVSPLHYHDAHKEPCVACVLQLFALIVALQIAVW